jgi:hypothetical protein
LIAYSSPSRQLSIDIRAKLSEKAYPLGEAMPRNGDEDDTTPRFDDESNTNNNEEGSKTKALIDAKLKDLMKRLKKLTTENNKLKRKDKIKRTK